MGVRGGGEANHWSERQDKTLKQENNLMGQHIKSETMWWCLEDMVRKRFPFKNLEMESILNFMRMLKDSLR